MNEKCFILKNVKRVKIVTYFLMIFILFMLKIVGFFSLVASCMKNPVSVFLVHQNRKNMVSF